MPAQLTPIRLNVFLLSIVTMLGCAVKDSSSGQSDQPATNEVSTASASGSRSAGSECPTVGEVSTIVGFQVRSLTGQMYGEQLVCGYIEAGDDAGMQITAYRDPMSEAEEDMTRMAKAVKATGGESASLETISVGEDGRAYGNSAKSEAAAKASGHYFHVEIVSGASTAHGEKKDAAVALLKRMIG